MTAAEEDRTGDPTPRAAGGRPVLQVRDLRTRFRTQGGGLVHAVNGIDFDLHEGELLGVVGESGSGKSVTMLSLLEAAAHAAGGDRLGPGPVGRRGPARARPRAALRHVRGGKVGFIFQDPMTSLNPVLSVGYQLTEPLRLHLGLEPARGAAACSGAAGGRGHPGGGEPARPTYPTSSRAACASA